MSAADLVWWALAAALCGLEVAARLGARVPRIGEVFSALVARRGLRAAVLAGWIWLGWHFFAR